MTDSLLNITIGMLEVPATVSERFLELSGNRHSLEGLTRLFRELGSLVSKDVKVLLRVDSATRGAASGTIACTKASSAAGDKVSIFIPGYPPAIFTAVATGGVAADGEYSVDAASDSAQAIELTNAINLHPLLKDRITASESSGTITLLDDALGSAGNNVVYGKVVGTGAAITLVQPTGGDDVLAQPSMIVTFGTADIVADDTISIGARVYTWKASASADGEITLSAAEATAAANFAAAVNADTTFKGLVTASVAAAVVTLTFIGDPRICQHISVDFAETNSGSVVLGGVVTIGTSEVPALGSTVTGSSTLRTFGSRGAA